MKCLIAVAVFVFVCGSTDSADDMKSLITKGCKDDATKFAPKAYDCVSKNPPAKMPALTEMMKCQQKSICVDADLKTCQKAATKGKEKEFQKWENDNKEAIRDSATIIAECLKKIK